jgi:hypothetical protein
MNPAVCCTRNGLSVISHIGEENFVENFEAALNEGFDHIGEQCFDRDIAPLHSRIDGSRPVAS